MLAILGMTTFNSCNKDLVPNIDVTAEKTNVKTYEIINLITHGNLANKYNATFDSVAIELLKTSDSTLTFYVPDIAEGEVLLKFDLATIKFIVTKTAEVSANQLITNFSQNFDAQVSSLNPSTPDEIAEVDSLIQYKGEVITLFNTLTEDEKRQAVLFYEANKEIFKSFAVSTYTNLDAPTTKRIQSKCPQIDFKSFYGCTAENLGDAATGLKNSSKEFIKMIGMAAAMGGTALSVTGPLGPVAWGITAVGMSLPLGMAGYLLITEVAPAAKHFGKSVKPFLAAPWIFRKELFQEAIEVFQDQTNTSLNLKSKFRSLTSTDGNINSGSGYFINAMTSLSENWNKLTALFGIFPTYKNTEEPANLATNEISISNISNSNVQYQGNTGQSVKFKSLSGNDENFSYNIRVTKEGFIEEKILTGKVLACPNTVTDIDGNVYCTVVIGNQTWMVQDLKVTKYRNGDPIASITDNKSWENLTTGAYCNYQNDLNLGRLYNWHAVNDIRYLAPVGWHIASIKEVRTLINYLGGISVPSTAEIYSIAGGKMKKTGTSHWNIPNTHATNSSGFTALPQGWRLWNGGYQWKGTVAGYWSSDGCNYNGNTTTYAWDYHIHDFADKITDSDHVMLYYHDRTFGQSIRCVKD